MNIHWRLARDKTMCTDVDRMPFRHWSSFQMNSQRSRERERREQWRQSGNTLTDDHRVHSTSHSSNAENFRRENCAQYRSQNARIENRSTCGPHARSSRSRYHRLKEKIVLLRLIFDIECNLKEDTLVTMSLRCVQNRHVSGATLWQRALRNADHFEILTYSSEITSPI